MRTFYVFLIIGAIIAALLGIKFIFFPSEKAAAPGTSRSAPAALSVEILVLKNQTVSNNIQAVGTILPNEKVDLSSEGSGKVTGLYFTEGSYVKKGQLLVKLNDADLQAQLKKAQVNLTLSKDIAARQEKLLAIEGTSKEDFDIAQNQVLSYQTDIDYIKTLIERTEVRAPFSGVIGFRNIALGSYVSPTTTIASLQQIDPIKIEFNAPEKYMNQFKAGQPLTFITETDQKTHSAKVQTIDPQINMSTRTVTIRGIAPNKANLLPGNFIKVNIDVSGDEDVVVIPTSAVVPILKGQKVYVMENGRATEKIIDIINRTDKTVQIEKGLSPGDSLIVTGIIMLKEGMEVNVAKIL